MNLSSRAASALALAAAMSSLQCGPGKEPPTGTPPTPRPGCRPKVEARIVLTKEGNACKATIDAEPICFKRLNSTVVTWRIDNQYGGEQRVKLVGWSPSDPLDDIGPGRNVVTPPAQMMTAKEKATPAPAGRYTYTIRCGDTTIDPEIVIEEGP